ncbi:acyl-CoA thioester hydrolase [Kineococcus radiotolerans]|uniref:Acyl-CoA thioester hydrolase n=1 Tax=Kineococcus radiotolerans TaxID=131568 RepID=A0A7W4TQ56_KINRA|nr:thioesterase family protein [Kineococcus radiotolerans]MBB2903068.1 acyl-CoA thioester hydrolase [Kineococcus radiotolerans]
MSHVDDLRLPHAVSVPIPLRWSDMDAFGHVNNTAFLRFFEDARFSAFPAAGVEVGGQVSTRAMLAVRHEVEYRSPLIYGRHRLTIDIWATRLGTSSVDVAYQAVAQHDDEADVAAVARSRMVLVDVTSGRPQPMTEEERAQFTPHLGEQVRFRGW